MASGKSRNLLTTVVPYRCEISLAISAAKPSHRKYVDIWQVAHVLKIASVHAWALLRIGDTKQGCHFIGNLPNLCRMAGHVSYVVTHPSVHSPL
jgi:hypothetical protein